MPSYYQHVAHGKNKVEMSVHQPVPGWKKEVTSSWGFPDELKSWNCSGHEGEKMLVHVYTTSQLVRLELNGRVVGEQAIDPAISINATFGFPHEPGTLIARCYDKGRETASQLINTTGRPKAVRLIADSDRMWAYRNDLSYIRAEIIESEGNIVPDGDDILVTFKVNGVGEIAGVGGGNPADMSGFQQQRKKAWRGTCLAIVRPGTTTGKIHIIAMAEGLQADSLTISAD